MEAFQLAVGLEVHAELLTRTKLFCSCAADRSREPNTRCCPVCAGLPGGLPTPNQQAVRLAIRAGLALHCQISRTLRFHRKHYFYPDLPKGYQITQGDLPLCANGWLDFEADGASRRARIARVHLEEDAGKLIHQGSDTLVDLNRCGLPLIEIVTEPDLQTANEAKAFLRVLRALLLAAGVSDCRMHEGAMRWDVNVSVSRAGDAALGPRTEIKNMNSFAYAAKAIDAEYARQRDAFLSGEPVLRETRRFDPHTGRTIPLRVKESAADYRFLPEADIPDIWIDEAEIAAIEGSMPELPGERAARYGRCFGLETWRAKDLAQRFPLADAFDKAAPFCQSPKRLAGILLQDIPRFVKEKDPVPFPPESLATLADLLETGKLHPASVGKALMEMMKTGEAPEPVCQRLSLLLRHDALGADLAVNQAIAGSGPLIEAYLDGKEKAFHAIMGKVMEILGGGGDPATVAALLKARLVEIRVKGQKEP